MSNTYLEKIVSTEETAGFSLKDLNFPQIKNLYVPIGVVGKTIYETEKHGGSVGDIKIPVPMNIEPVLGGSISDEVFDHFQK